MKTSDYALIACLLTVALLVFVLALYLALAIICLSRCAALCL